MQSKDDIRDWDSIASAYSQKIEACGDRCFPEIRDRFWTTLGDIGGKTVLDLGCGQGWLTKELTNRGAVAIGVDGSGSLIERARSQFPELTFLVADLAEGLPDLDIKFDTIISHMVVMDIPEIKTLFNAVSQALQPGGEFFFTLPHPCFFQQKSHQDVSGQWFKKVTNYLTPEVWRIDSFGGHNHYHRTIEEYVSALSQVGLLVSHFHEPPHESKSKRIDPEFLKTFPVFLMVGARKTAEPELGAYADKPRRSG